MLKGHHTFWSLNQLLATKILVNMPEADFEGK